MVVRTARSKSTWDQGFAGFPRGVAPSQDQADALKGMMERKGRLAPFVDLRVAPWCDPAWHRGGAAAPSLQEVLLHAVGEEAASVTGVAGTGDALVAAATARAAASVVSVPLQAAAYLAAVVRVVKTLALVGSFGAQAGVGVAAAYTSGPTALAARRGFTVMSQFDTRLRKHAAASENWTANELAALFSWDSLGAGVREMTDLILRVVLEEQFWPSSASSSSAPAQKAQQQLQQQAKLPPGCGQLPPPGARTGQRQQQPQGNPGPTCLCLGGLGSVLVAAVPWFLQRCSPGGPLPVYRGRDAVPVAAFGARHGFGCLWAGYVSLDVGHCAGHGSHGRAPVRGYDSAA